MIHDWVVWISSDDEAVSRGQIAAKVASLHRLMLRKSHWNVTGETGEDEALSWASVSGNQGEKEHPLHLVSHRFSWVRNKLWASGEAFETKRRLRILWLTARDVIGG
jgi:hypothetical protein